MDMLILEVPPEDRGKVLSEIVVQDLSSRLAPAHNNPGILIYAVTVRAP
jgi:hypothetical protein